MPKPPNNQHGGDGRFIRTPQTAERDAQICRMRAKGMTHRAIAQQLGLHHSSIQDAIQRALHDITEEPAKEVRALELHRLDHYLTRLAPRIDDGDDKAINTALRVAERRAKLLGLDAAQPLHIELDRRTDLEAATVADAITAALDALDLTPEQHATAIAAAQTRLSENTETD